MYDFINAACEIAREIGEYQKEQLSKPRHVEFKGEINLVTEVDKACEKRIVSFLKDRFPSHDIIAEEGGGHNTKSEWCWHVDPLDGTVNYTHRYPLFAVSLGLAHKGKVVVGVVYEPNLDELFVAERGGGALLNDKPIRVSSNKKLIECMFCTGFPYEKELMKESLDNFSKMLFHARALRRDGVASTDLCYVACGRFDGFWERGLFSWDVAAGSLVIEEAGGRVSSYNGGPLDIMSREVIATNGHMHDAVLNILGEKK